MADDADIGKDDAEALRVRRADLQALLHEISAAAIMLPKPETYLEAERAVRTITIADRFVQKLDLADAPKPVKDGADKDETATTSAPASAIAKPPLPVRVRGALRDLADRMMAAAKTIPLPQNPVTTLRALGYVRACDRMLTQLYTSPKPKPVKPLPVEPAKPVNRRLENEQIERELWEQFSQSPEAQAVRAAKNAPPNLPLNRNLNRKRPDKPLPKLRSLAIRRKPKPRKPPEPQKPLKPLPSTLALI